MKTFQTDQKRSDTVGHGTGAVWLRLLARIGRITSRYRHRSFLTDIDHYLSVLDRSGNGYGQTTDKFSTGLLNKIESRYRKLNNSFSC